MTAAQIAQHLNGRKAGAGWMARCPSHDDANPSLSLTDSNGKLLVHCFGGCDQRDVIQGLRERGLWEPSAEAKPKRTIVATYPYVDADGNPIYEIVRFEPKDFQQRYWNGNGWTWRKHPNQVLYRLPAVLANEIVFITEGEADADALHAMGFCGTTNAGGANAPWLPQFSAALAGRECVILPDADEPGRKRGELIADALLGIASRIRIFELPGAKDAREWFRQGHSEVEFVSLLEGPDFA